MLKIIEKAYFNTPIKFLVKPGVRFIAGHACTLVDYNGYQVADICKPDQFPFGIIGSSKLVKGSNISFAINDMIQIWHQRMIFRTDNFEHSNYDPGDKLYVGEVGMLTNEPILEGQHFVARLTGMPNERMNGFEALWL